jgi:hypothetical protein
VVGQALGVPLFVSDKVGVLMEKAYLYDIPFGVGWGFTISKIDNGSFDKRGEFTFDLVQPRIPGLTYQL